MTPLIKKTLFRVKKLKRPFRSDDEKKKHILGSGLRRAMVASSIVLVIIATLYSGRLPIRTLLKEGDISVEDLYAPFDFNYESGIDEEKTKLKQQEALEKVLDVYNIEQTPLEKACANITSFFDELSSMNKAKAEPADADIESIKTRFSIDLSVNDLKLLLEYPDKARLKEIALNILKEVYSNPIVSEEFKKALRDSSKTLITVKKPSGDKLTKKLDELADITGARKTAEQLLSKQAIDDARIKNAFYRLLSVSITPNLTFNYDDTESAKKEARSGVSSVYSIVEKSKGEIVIRKGQRVSKDHTLQINSIRKISTSEEISLQFWGIVLLIFLLAFLLYMYLKYFEQKIFSKDNMMLLIGLLIVAAAVFARIIVSSPLPSYFIPVASVSMLLTLLVNGRVAAIALTAAAIVVSIVAGVNFNIFMVSVVGGITAVCTICNARHRSQILKSGIYVGIFNFITICAIGLLSNLETRIFLKEGLWGIASGITSAAITMIFLPVLESVFKLTTDIKLLELADLNHPLLKKMVTNATGTYHHSIIVGNLAEAAADAIGANPLLARIGSYYHDIGKLEKAEYFAENKQISSDIHDKLSPSMSSLIITNHVKDGVELAEKYKLGSTIREIIEQHHGTGLVTYFYHQAVEKGQQEQVIPDETFRYPGPKPQTKESAIVMFADSIEAASRVLQNTTPQRLKELVRKIINDKFIDRQLDECELTLKDINNIADSFVRILTGVYHARIEYPTSGISKNGNGYLKRPKKDKA